MSKRHDPNVGRAFRSARDGTVRWITHRSDRGYYHMLWLNEKTGVWNLGGREKAADFARFYGGEEVPAPQPGETYKMAGVFGAVSSYEVPNV